MSPAPVPPRVSRSGWRTPLVTVVAGVLPLLLCGGALFAILFPLLSRSSNDVRYRTQCSNNLKNIALGLQNYHDTYKVFPFGAMHSGLRGSSEKIGPSWWVGVLPFMEQGPLYDRMSDLQFPGAPGNGAYNAQNLNASMIDSPLPALYPDYMRCPSSRLPLMETNNGPILLPSYVGISGGCDIASDSPDYQVGAGPVEITVPASDRNYLNKRKGRGHVPGGIVTASGMLVPCEAMRMADCTDGTSNTIIVGEQSDWLRNVDPSNDTLYHGDAGWDTNGTGPDSASTTAGGGFVSGTVESTPVPLAVNGLPGSPPRAYDCYNITTVRYPVNVKHVLGATPYPGCSEDHGINNPLQSPHSGGVLVVGVDGASHFISNDTDLAVLLRIAIRNDGQNVNLD